MSDQAVCLHPVGTGEKGLCLVEARTLRQRAFGLMGRELCRLPEGTGVLFRRCTCIHTFGMRGPISLTWIAEGARGPSRSAEVVSVDPCIPPNRIIWAPRGADGVIESHALQGPPRSEIVDMRTRRMS